MNVDRGQEDFSDAEVEDLRVRLMAFRDANGYSWGQLGIATDIASSTLSQWGPGRYAGDNRKVAWKVARFFRSHDERTRLEIDAPDIPHFHPTETSRKIMAQCSWAQRGKIAVVCGPPGISKTASFLQYQATHPNVHLGAMNPATRAPGAMLNKLLKPLGAHQPGSNTQNLMSILCDRLAGSDALLIVDEAQHLTDVSLEVLRAIHDEIGAGIVFGGNATVLTRLQGGARKAEFAQLFSRVSMPHVYGKPTANDVAVLCAAWGVKHPRELEFLAAVAAQPGHLRNLTQVMEMATFLASSQGEDRVLDHLKQAWTQQSRQAA
ncbi:MAG TPA: AAA family ATPase [Caulobacteraceae bacterium]|nr:AAA family ATPase [Caulobacteraceae bacterium]